MSASQISNTDAFIQAFGGTPEGIVGAITMGFKRVIYIGNGPQENVRMQSISIEDENSHNVDYNNAPSLTAALRASSSVDVSSGRSQGFFLFGPRSFFRKRGF